MPWKNGFPIKNKYYSHTLGGSSFPTHEEADFVASCNKIGTAFPARIHPDGKPLSFFEGGVSTGLLGGLTQEIMDHTGLNTQMPLPQTDVEYNVLLRTTDIGLGMRWHFSSPESRGFILTEPCYSTTVSRLSRKGDLDPAKTAAVITGSNSSSGYLPATLTDEVPLPRNGVEEDVQAVVSGRADFLFLCTPIAQHRSYNGNSAVWWM